MVRWYMKGTVHDLEVIVFPSKVFLNQNYNIHLLKHKPGQMRLITCLYNKWQISAVCIEIDGRDQDLSIKTILVFGITDLLWSCYIFHPRNTILFLGGHHAARKQDQPEASCCPHLATRSCRSLIPPDFIARHHAKAQDPWPSQTLSDSGLWDSGSRGAGLRGWVWEQYE